ncbi:serine hydrolase domain-containing protein [Nonomuraea sp. NPDC005650]|uniref:serine hydrolase domain-containing protein n=1 Tax=Nonomuraea sp. NPDC005650 TaxID=3157045 RepID=UPI0033BA0E96
MLEPRFSAVAEAFTQIIGKGADRGAALCVYHRGVPVVDIWAGTADVRTRRPWDARTIAPITGATKGLLAVAVLSLVEDGTLGLDTPVAECWPEFAAEGKRDITVRWLLSHRAGVPALDKPMNARGLIAGDSPADALAAQAPVWQPGTAHGYHPSTGAWILEEVVRRVTGSTVGKILSDRIATPMGEDVSIGLDEGDTARLAPLIFPIIELMRARPKEPEFAEFGKAVFASKTPLARSLNTLSLSRTDQFNDPAFLAIGEPSMSGVASASGLARLYASLIGEVEGHRLIDPGLLAAATREESGGHDRVLLMNTRFGLGFMLPGGPLWPGETRTQFGHGGTSGALAFADPANRLAFAYVPNRMSGYIEGADANARRLAATVYGALL